ncbi:MAG: hypothetical protein H0A75_04215 [Candidatus Methanofishera endochildressiae]|uniref:Uncharacterized protein n=1 Tax=Candidatus Methanofishera endochildressiae TaxID=2738884 RepID=A0A7Z0MNY1_9GAMM|nr:hypothetical protein [Candidatus Methanofishera endochildressiae]
MIPSRTNSQPAEVSGSDRNADYRVDDTSRTLVNQKSIESVNTDYRDEIPSGTNSQPERGIESVIPY